MFELSILRKYLIPQRKQLSASLIGFVSLGVISAVVWLILTFLSVTEGIERTWLQKLTSLQAPLRITPTQAYFDSYYYKADTVSSKANYTPRSLKEKVDDPGIDLYDPETDASPDLEWADHEKGSDGKLKDPVALASSILQKVRPAWNGLEFSPFEMSGALLRIELQRDIGEGRKTQSFVTQASYLSSFPESNSYIQSLIVPPTSDDLHQLLLKSFEQGSHCHLLSCLQIETVKPVGSLWKVPISLLPENREIEATALVRNRSIIAIALDGSTYPEKGVLRKQKEKLVWNSQPVNAPIMIAQPVTFKARLLPSSISKAQKISDLQVEIEGSIGSTELKGLTQWNSLQISAARIERYDSPFFHLFSSQPGSKLTPMKGKEVPIIVSKNFYDSGARLGDKGWLQYQAASAGSVQEHRTAVVIAGFYDPGLLSVGHRCVLAPFEIVHMIHTTSPIEHFAKADSMGFAVWHHDLSKTAKLAQALQKEFEKEGISLYWKITTYHDYEFSKDLMQQFKSDRFLFTFLGMIVLIVACSNVISFLLLLVQNKRKEIGLLQALGASKKSIAYIFGGCGAVIGLMSTLFGAGLSILTLKNLDSIVKLLSFLQGHPAFNTAFYGSSLPSELSLSAMLFVIIMTPLLSLIAGLIPAWKACRLSPSETLRSE